MAGWPKNRYEAALYFCPRGKRVLDIGCADGSVLYSLKDNFDELYGLEISPKKYECARKKLEGLQARLINGDIEEGLPFEDGFFDVVISTDVIQIFIDIFGCFKEMTRVLKPGGTQLVTTPNFADIRRRLTLLKGKFPSTSAGNEGFDTNTEHTFYDGRHLHYFTYSSLEKLFQKYHYSTITKYGFGSRGKFHNLYPSLLSPTCLIVGTK